FVAAMRTVRSVLLNTTATAISTSPTSNPAATPTRAPKGHLDQCQGGCTMGRSMPSLREGLKWLTCRSGFMKLFVPECRGRIRAGDQERVTDDGRSEERCVGKE